MESLGYKLYWGDMHNNIRLKKRFYEKFYDIKEVVKAAEDTLDFLAVAYYPFKWYTKNGLRIESCGERKEFIEEWKVVQKVVAEANNPGKFVTFLGYEWHGLWHGDRQRYGHHNVYYLNDHKPLICGNTLPELYEELRKTKAIAIPHHTGYQVGETGKDWDFHDDDLSPLVEVYSVQHGSSEGCNTPLTMNRNLGMSPRVSGGTVQDGLERGYRLGLIASSDHPYPGCGGLVGVYAEKLTRESIWDAFMDRRVYGVTGDRIKLTFFINGHFIGERFKSVGPIKLWGEVTGSHAIDRVEIIKNGEVIYTYCHSGRWKLPKTENPIRAKLRLQFGWGPNERYGFKHLEEHVWKGSLDVKDGRLVSVEPRFTDFGQKIEIGSKKSCNWTLISKPYGPREHMLRTFQELTCEVEAPLKSEITLKVGSHLLRFSLEEAFRRSWIIALTREAEEITREEFDLYPEDVENPDHYWFNSYKVKIHKAIPWDGYYTKFSYVDSDSKAGLSYYYLRVSQLNGHMAWSSPIWVTISK